jgi:hypothetical protein
MAKKPEERVATYEQEVKDLSEQLGVMPVHLIVFPRYRKVPRLASFAVWLLNRMGGQIATKYRVGDGTITNNRSTKRRR